MTSNLSRRAVMLGCALLLAAGTTGLAQDKPVLRFSAVFSEKDIRAEMMKMFGEEIKDSLTLQPYFGGTLFKQGTDIRLQATDPATADIVPDDGQELQVWGVVTNAIKSMPV